MSLPAASYADRIRACWQHSLESILEAGRILIEAKAELEHGTFQAMVERELPFGPSTARRLMIVAADARLTDRAHVHVLPPNWGTLYELSKLGTPTLQEALAQGAIRPDMERAEAESLVKMERTAPARAAYAARQAVGGTVDDLHALAASGFRAGAILADPNWKFVAWSARGEGRSANQHYDTARLDAITALPVAALAADDSALFLCCVDWDVEHRMAFATITAWGFEHKTTAFTWVKTNSSGEGFHFGQGYWTRANPEVCLFATRGNPQRLNADVAQLIVAPFAGHSRKPDEINRRIERLVSGPYLELHARRELPGWTTWGDEIRAPQIHEAAE